MAGDEDKTGGEKTVETSDTQRSSDLALRVTRSEISWSGPSSAEFISEQLVPAVREALGEPNAAVIATYSTAPEPVAAQVYDRMALPRASHGSGAYDAWAVLRTITSAIQRNAPRFSTEAVGAPPALSILHGLEHYAAFLAAQGVFTGVPSTWVRSFQKTARRLSDALGLEASASVAWETADPVVRELLTGLPQLAAYGTWPLLDPQVWQAEQRSQSQAREDAINRHLGAIAEAERRLREVEQRADATVRKASALLEKARDAVTADVIAKHNKTFVGVAEGHGASAKRWLIAAASLGAVTIGATVVGLFWLPLAGGGLTAAVVASIASRVVLFSLLAAATFWSARNYAVHRHNAILNRQRVNALGTFELLADAARTEDERTIVLKAVTQCLFAIQPTSPDARATDPSVLGLAELVIASRTAGRP